MSTRAICKTVSLLVLGVAFWLLGTVDAIAGTIKLGIISDLSGPGMSAATSTTTGFSTYINMINSQGGVNGNKIELIIEDGKFNTSIEVGLYKKMRQMGVLTIIQTTTTGSQAALMSEYIKDKNVVFPISRVAFLFKPVNPYIFITSPDYNVGYECMVDYVHKLKPGGTIGIVYPDNKYGQDGFNYLKEKAAKKNLKTLGVVLNFDAVDATSQVTQLKSLNPDYVLLVSAARTAKTFLDATQKLGLNVPLMANFNTTDHVLFPLAKHIPAVKNLIGVAFYSTLAENVPGVRLLAETGRKFGVPEEKIIDGWYAAGWTDAMVFVEGLKRCGNNITVENLRNQIESIKNFDTGGLTDALSYSPTNHTGTNKVKFVKMNLEKGYWEPITGWVSPE